MLNKSTFLTLHQNFYQLKITILYACFVFGVSGFNKANFIWINAF
jgi:hypothetical protein